MIRTDMTTIEQLFTKSRRVLVCFRRGGGGDAIASALALAGFLRKFDTDVDIVSEDFICPSQYAFLEDHTTIETRLPHLQKFAITVDISEVGLTDHTDEIENGKFRVYLTPEEGRFSKDMIRVASSEYRYDLIVTVGTRSFESLGDIFFKHGEFFHTLPVINIDHDGTNRHYGNVNIVDITKSSSAEIIYDLIGHIGREHISPSIAHYLLTGIITKTRSFKSSRIEPHTLRTAGELTLLGADREDIVKHLYRTRSISTLKLWGTALSNLDIAGAGLIVSTITRADFAKTGADERDLEDVIMELIANSPDARRVVLLHEHAETRDIHGVLTVLTTENALDLTNAWQPIGNREAASFFLHDMTLFEAKQLVTSTLRQTHNIKKT